MLAGGSNALRIDIAGSNGIQVAVEIVYTFGSWSIGGGAGPALLACCDGGLRCHGCGRECWQPCRSGCGRRRSCASARRSWHTFEPEANNCLQQLRVKVVEYCCG